MNFLDSRIALVRISAQEVPVTETYSAICDIATIPNDLAGGYCPRVLMIQLFVKATKWRYSLRNPCILPSIAQSDLWELPHANTVLRRYTSTTVYNEDK